MPYKDPVKKAQCKNRSYHRRYATEAGRLRILFNDARRRAKKRGTAFTITTTDLPPIPGLCPLLGIGITLDKNRDTSPSIDRIDSTKGYVPGNVWIISDRANRIKNNSSLNELVLLALNLAKKVHEEHHGVSPPLLAP